MKNKLNPLRVIVFLLFTFLFIACSNEETNNKNSKSEDTTLISGELVIFHAGSLSVPFKEISTAFNKKYPDLKISTEAAGSVACARKITDLGRKCDVFGSADYNIINKMLIPEYADWNIKFASNEMAIVFTEESKYHNDINSDNWTEILLKDGVYYGRADPNSDPCGYRTILTLKLAEKFYIKPTLTRAFLSKDLNYIRPKEVDLIALLETNSIDYTFLYRSVAEQHGLQYLLLPDEVNLKNPDLVDYYSSVSININGKKPGEKINQKGEPMVYGITIPKNAPNKRAAEAFVKFVLSQDKGMAILEKNGQPSLVPSKTDTYKNIPDDLKQFAIEH